MTTDQTDAHDYAPEYLSRQEAADVLHTTVPVVDRLIATGVLPRYRLHGRYIRLRTKDVLQLQDVPVEWLARA